MTVVDRNQVERSVRQAGGTDRDVAEVLAFDTFLRVRWEVRHGALDSMPPQLQAYAAGNLNGADLDYRDLHGFEGDDT